MASDLDSIKKNDSGDPVQFSMRTDKNKIKNQIKQPTNVRTTLLVDYQPDVCKDYKQTGFCGYGDSCKFLHSRDDFKAGWKLNQDWKISDDDDNKNNDNGGLDDKITDIPFKCVICKDDYKTPIVTNCNHYFCSKCFTDRVRKDTNCFICGKETNGTAKSAKTLQKLLKDRDQNK
ncbi:hypothetical protein Kpol_1025p31 [Vanderwaltozyma polyspora DSM 70294]|uniref:Pre-mRNA-splicing factor CWC24 n=1 Tax=Vanderwaltozyma polyspora (strain ATCC 22028 / DSM 70294 / BCRC 21397 / CBS 2163 / NBRC 10782 / NRRL Y-8283 / UCD 57-17) TaxID=436907 RepID=A7TKV6_VANPO|nr:uncharacterized protein Kpol_1025p31 [Vanderwaltozyma polyspora DSM 70294]EDO17111.1 hypothetical protein Kpol_1025p31 [Vanderwaltozyma polyspora DSM 70294]